MFHQKHLSLGTPHVSFFVIFFHKSAFFWGIYYIIPTNWGTKSLRWKGLVLWTTVALLLCFWPVDKAATLSVLGKVSDEFLWPSFDAVVFFVDFSSGFFRATKESLLISWPFNQNPPRCFLNFHLCAEEKIPIVNVFLRFKPWQVNFSYLIHVIFLYTSLRFLP